MKNHFLICIVSLLGCAASGCSLGYACTLVACPTSTDAGVKVVLAGLTTSNPSALPLSIKVCADGGSCATATVTKPNASFTCLADGDGFSANCVVQDNGDVTVNLTIDANTGAKSSVTLTATVTDSANVKLLDDSKSVTMTSRNPNGEDCDPVCREGTVTFTS